MKKTLRLEGELTLRREKTPSGGSHDRAYLDGSPLDLELEEFPHDPRKIERADDMLEWSAGQVRITIETVGRRA